MSKYQGGMIGSVANATSGTAYTGRANGVFPLPQQIVAKSSSLWAIGQTRPNPPTIGTATGASATTISVAFIPPVQDGGSTITSYTVTSSGGQTATGASSPIIVTGLISTTSYTFTVTATNALGTSISSEVSNSVLPLVVDPYFSSVSLLMNGDTLTDISSNPKTITNTGSVAVNTSVKKFGTGSIYVPSGSNYLSIPSAAGDSTDISSGDFTIECWINKPTSSTAGFLHKFNTSGTARSWFFGQDGSGSIYFYGSTSGSAWEVAIGTGSIPANTWTHVALVRYGNVIKIFINGVQSGSDYAFSGTFYNSATPIYIGNNAASASSWSIGGYMDDLRITKGIARYTANFTPPTAPLPTL